MKMRKLTAIALALILTLALSACGAPKGPDLTGTYTLYAMDYDEDTTLLASELFDGESYITLKSGGSAEFCMEDDVANVKWKADGTNITVTAADGDMTGTIKDGILTLAFDDSNLYFVAEGTPTDSIGAITLDEMLSGAISGTLNETPEPTDAPETPEPTDAPETPETPAPTDAPAPAAPDTPKESPKPAANAEPTEIQKKWNGWYFGCIDLDDCTGQWESRNGETFDATMYIELGADGSGRLLVFDPFGALVQNNESNCYVNALCHADSQYLYGDGGEAFGCEVNSKNWIMVHNLMVPEKVNTDFESENADGETIDCDFQFKPWGDRWEDDNYTKFIPRLSEYIRAIDTGMTSPFGDAFPGLGIANYEIAGVNGAGGSGGSAQPADQPASGGSGGGNAALLGTSPAKLDVNDRGIVYVYYPADQFRYDDTYGKLKNDETGVGILIDPMLGENNFEELKASYEKNNSDEKDYSLVETTVNGRRAQIMKYTDWLGSTMRVDIDFGGKHDGYYGISFAVSGDTLSDCDTELVWAIIESMELAK